MKIKKYFDCSVNDYSNRNHNKESYGPIENDIMRDLTKYSHLYNFKRVYDYTKADVIVTNTMYPDDILEWSDRKNIPLIKRMDGIYWQNDLKHKNSRLNLAALQSNEVIFISNYSKLSLLNLYNIEPIKSTVILNDVDDIVFYKRNIKNDRFTWVTSATNWNREIKRLNVIKELSRFIKNDVIKLIGHCDEDLPDNIIKCGYIDNDEKMSEIIGSSDAFISLFFRDSGSKVTCQAVQCGLPILHTSSGGLMEIVKTNGIVVNDYNEIDFLDKTPKLDMDDVICGYNDLKDYYNDILDIYEKRAPYQDTLSKYFEIMKKYID